MLAQYMVICYKEDAQNLFVDDGAYADNRNNSCLFSLRRNSNSKSFQNMRKSICIIAVEN